MHVVVTGATGFVGRHVVAELVRRGLTVTGTSPSAADVPGGSARPLDVHAPPADPFAALGRPDVVVHLAWAGLPDYGSLHHLERELPAHYAFLAALIRGGLQRLVVAGTCLEYGMAEGRLDERRPTDPATPYGLAKDVLRRQLEQLRAVTPFALSWARLFYLFGPGQHPRSLYAQLTAAAAAGAATFPMSGGEQLRDFLPIEEAAAAIADLAMDTADHGPVNVCSGRPVSVRCLVERWIADHGWPIAPELGRYPYPSYEPFAFWGDRTKLDCIRQGLA